MTLHAAAGLALVAIGAGWPTGAFADEATTLTPSSRFDSEAGIEIVATRSSAAGGDDAASTAPGYSMLFRVDAALSPRLRLSGVLGGTYYSYGDFLNGGGFATPALGLHHVRTFVPWKLRVGAVVAIPVAERLGIEEGGGYGPRDISTLVLAATGMGRQEFWLWWPAATLALPARLERSLGATHSIAAEIALGLSGDWGQYEGQYWIQGALEYAHRWSCAVAGVRLLVAPSIPQDGMDGYREARDPHTSPTSVQIFDRFVAGPVTIGIAVILGYGTQTPVYNAHESDKLDWALHLSVAKSLPDSLN